MSTERKVLRVEHRPNFEVRCDTGTAAESLSVNVGQRIRLDGVEALWHSIGIYAKQEEDGTLAVKLVVFNPDWQEPMQIACVRSRPHDEDCLTSLGCNLDQITFVKGSRAW